MLLKLQTVCVGLVAAVGCMPGKDRVDVFTQEEFDQIRQFGPLPDLPPSPTNKYADNAAVAAFGQRLFFEKGYAHALTIADPALGAIGDTHKVSCPACHDVNNYYTDTRSKPNSLSVGIAWTNRNTPTLVNAAYYTWGSW